MFGLSFHMSPNDLVIIMKEYWFLRVRYRDTTIFNSNHVRYLITPLENNFTEIIKNENLRIKFRNFELMASLKITLFALKPKENTSFSFYNFLWRKLSPRNANLGIRIWFSTQTPTFSWGYNEKVGKQLKVVEIQGQATNPIISNISLLKNKATMEFAWRITSGIFLNTLEMAIFEETKFLNK